MDSLFYFIISKVDIDGHLEPEALFVGKARERSNKVYLCNSD